IHVATSRGVDPLASMTSTRAIFREAARKSRSLRALGVMPELSATLYAFPNGRSSPASFCLEPLDGHQHPFGRSRRIKPWADLVVTDACHRIRKSLQHGNAERQRRLADSLGPVDGRLIGL